ncbi:hypothetical protein J2Z83_001329 [Virgibacillus natechei]|uniref:C2H2-type domain-containing protein n=1 Tax=Virgibacillus natechei TaxID=1216297 RepID=A0ABS4IE95_9BACI|nr:DUF2628 domain-containing protein [Virgibacillus natechei]MBP1969225.1 hypothetical protein [Virgibacillus natechei]UZD12387.1 DUF2628 domain-containing protein [Virgibacillus natechei]
MYCSNCGKEIDPNGRFCTHCSHPLHTEHDYQAAAIESDTPDDVIFEEDMRLFVGKNSAYYDRKWQKAEEKNGVSFNFAAFFLSILWLGYRKMYTFVFYIAILFLGIDLVLYFIGYEYEFARIDPIDQGINIGVAVTIGLYGNHLYKKEAEKRVQSIQNTTTTAGEKEKQLKEKGGKVWYGPILAFLIIIVVYVIPTLFIPVNVNAVDEARYSSFYEYPDVEIGVMFDSVFDNGEWHHVEERDTYDIVEYTGIDAQNYDIAIQFQIFADSDAFEVFSVTMDGMELDVFDINLFLENVFTEYDRLYY